MKRFLILLLFSGLTLSAYAQDVSGLYSAASNSVVYLQHQILLNSADCTKPELWKRLEKLTKRSILDTAWPLASGSGFFLDTDGTILTNRHVVDVGSLHVVRHDSIQSVKSSLESDFSSTFSADERAIMLKDFEAMISKGRYSFNAMLGTKDLGAVSILSVASEDEPDLAIVRAIGGPFQGIKLAPSTMIGPDLVGIEVLSFGYPLGGQLDMIFKERTVTMNRGSISAFRRTELSLQHSAAISHGNSGGPLLSSNGLVLGVNTAGLQEQEGNSLFYAIDIGEVRNFLSEKGYSNTLLWNQRLPMLATMNANLKLNALGEVECSADVILDIDKNVDVLLDGTKVGVGPMFLRLTNPLSSLELNGPTGNFSAKLRMLSSITGSTTIKPFLVPGAVSVTINSNPSGATVIADGKVMGKTPLNIALVPDNYIVRLRQDGQWYEDTPIEVRLGYASEISLSGQTAYPITLKELPQDASITLRFESKLGKVDFTNGEKVNLPTGDWNLNIEGSDLFTGVRVPVRVLREPVTVDLTSFKQKGSLRIIGFDSKAKLWIDDRFYPNLAADTLQLPLGVHSVYVWEDGLQPLDKINITVRSDNDSFVTWDRIRGHDANSRIFTWSGAGAGAIGSLLLGLGIYGSQNSVAIGHTTSYEEYLSFRSTAKVGAVSGVVLLIGAGAAELIALLEKSKYENQRKYMSSLEGKE